MIVQTGLYILIAEDDTDDAEIITDSFLKHPAFDEVQIASNGAELLKVLKQEKRPDIILTDINMPIMDGIEALREIHSAPQLQHIPAFVYSTTINPAYEAQCVELGCKGFLIKPYDLEGFEAIPTKLLEILEK
jgi:CheY-like chemotaxis protein